ncbi:MAG: ComEC/Rec2 family competence protein, partial [Micromonosporaceae bacterium]|nr:ComEC/Rec2 family competence protein [Micromonosporaceae bacterium]
MSRLGDAGADLDRDSPCSGKAVPRADFRLAGTALGCWLAACCGLRIPAVAGLAVAGTAAVISIAIAAGVIVATGRLSARGRKAGRAETIGWITIAATLGVVIGASVTAARVAERDAQPLAALVARQATVTAGMVVREDPRLLSGARAAGTVLIEADLVRIEPEDGPASVAIGRIVVIASGAQWRRLLPWQRVRGTGRLAPAKGGDLTGAVLLVNSAPVDVGRPAMVQRAALGLRAGLRKACSTLPSEVAGLLPGLAIGDTEQLDQDLEEDFRATGMTHLCAVSGSNCAIVVGAVLLLARWLRAGPRASAALGGLALVGFVILVRPSPSVLRAAAMGGLALLALATGRSKAAMPALAASVIMLVALDPALAMDAGFALSVLATAGLLLLVPGWVAALRARRVPPGVAEAIAVPAAAQVACAPVIAGLSGTVSLVAVPVNLLATPAVAPVTILGVGATVLSPLWATGAKGLALLGSFPAGWLVWLARAGAGLPVGQVPWPAGWGGGLLLGVMLVCGMLLARIRPVRRVLLVAITAAGVGAISIRITQPGWPPEGWSIAMCDVGQGDAVALAAGHGQAVVVDAGPEPGLVNACLRDLGVTAVPMLVISHFHDDHVGGVSGVLNGRSVATVVVPEYAEPQANFEALQSAAAAARVPLVTARSGASYAAGAVGLTVLAAGGLLRGTRSDPNNNSLVIRAVVNGVSVLLPGDAEIEQQEDLLAGDTRHALPAAILKVPHHGSSYQYRPWLLAVNPRVALVSVGQGNAFGHPSGQTLRWLADLGTVVVRTDQSGDVA